MSPTITTIHGLTLDQIEMLAKFYEDVTGRPAVSIGFAEVLAEHYPDPDYKSPGCPEGYDTVVGYLTQFEPAIWDMMDHFADSTQRDGFWLMHRARERGLVVYKVQACPWLVRQGIFEVNAYPVELLRERFKG